MKIKKEAGTLLIRAVLSLAAVILLIWGLDPLITVRRFHVGVWGPLAAGILLLAGSVFYPAIRRCAHWLWQRKAGRALLIFLYSFCSLLFVLFITVSGFMLVGAARPAPENATVIVLGASVRQGSPSQMLADRLDAAARYLDANPQSVCIVSGGQGEDEPETEAAVMRRYLLDKGIDDSRLYLEDRSTNTYENIANSRKIIEEEGLNTTVVIATQEFHQYRGQTFARKAGFRDVGPLTCRSPLHLLPSYWIREFAAVCRMWVLGY